jgi:universal stress protein A
MAARFGKILCPIDFSDNSLAALDLAVDLARQNAATLCLIHVVPAPPGSAQIPPAPSAPDRAAEEVGRRRLQKLVEERPETKITFSTVVCSGDPAAEIVQAVTDLLIDLVVMATHGRTGVSHFFLGSVAEQVVRRSAAPVLTVRPRRPPA